MGTLAKRYLSRRGRQFESLPQQGDLDLVPPIQPQRRP
jgi:hypothetical protein